MSPSSALPSARDPFDNGEAPWTERTPAAAGPADGETTRPLPEPGGVGSGARGVGTPGDRRDPDTMHDSPAATAAMPALTDDDARGTSRAAAPQSGRTGVASGRLHPRDGASRYAGPVGDDHLTPAQDRITAEAAWDTMRPDVRPDGASAVRRPTAEELRARQKRRFGGLQALPGLMGLLAAMALGALLSGVLALVAPQFGVDTAGSAGDVLERAWQQPGATALWGAVAALGVVEFLSMLAGGYVAGRMGRFSGPAQGLSVWLWSLLAHAVASGAVLLWADATELGGPRWVVQQVVGGNPGVGLVALAGLLVLGLLAAILGGTWGMRYHRKVDAWTVSHALSE